MRERQFCGIPISKIETLPDEQLLDLTCYCRKDRVLKIFERAQFDYWDAIINRIEEAYSVTRYRTHDLALPSLESFDEMIEGLESNPAYRDWCKEHEESGANLSVDIQLEELKGRISCLTKEKNIDAEAWRSLTQDFSIETIRSLVAFCQSKSEQLQVADRIQQAYKMFNHNK